MTQLKGVSGGRLNVAVISAGDYFMPRLLVEFAGRHAGVTLNLSVHNRADLLTHLADNLTDLAVMVRPPQDTDTEHQPFAPHPYVIVAAPGHALAAAAAIPMARLVREAFIVREHGSDTWQSMVDAFGRHMAQLNVTMQIKSTETIKQAVMVGMGVSFLSAHTVSHELQAGSLVMLDVRGFPLMLHWYLVQRRHKRLPPVAQAFKQFLLDEGERLVGAAVPLPRGVAGRAQARVSRIDRKGR